MPKRFAATIFDLKTNVLQRSDLRSAAAMKAFEHRSRDEAARTQRERAGALATRAFRTVPFYREHYRNAGFSEADVGEPANFSSLPILEKDSLREAQASLLASDAPRRALIASTTGGSTGTPLTVYQDRRTPAASLWWRVYRWWGLHPSADTAAIHRLNRTRAEELRHRIEWWPTRHALLDARAMNGTSMTAFVHQLQRIQPQLLHGYVDGLYEFARFAVENELQLPAPKAVAVTASMLTSSKRAAIEAIFDAPLYDCYRSAEVPWIAAQCAARDGLHVLADARLLETVDEAGAATESEVTGDVLLTDLLNTVFPLIRYRIGDRTALRSEQCDCGISLPLIESVQGRVNDVLIGDGGRRITGGLSTLFNRWPCAVTQFQIHQRSDGTVDLRYVPGSATTDLPLAVESAARELQSFLGPCTAVVTTPVAEIEHTGGKTRLVQSDLR